MGDPDGGRGPQQAGPERGPETTPANRVRGGVIDQQVYTVPRHDAFPGNSACHSTRVS